MQGEIISIGGGGIFEDLMEGLNINRYKLLSRRTGYDFSDLVLLPQVFDELEDVDTTVFFTLDDYDGRGSVDALNSRELIAKNDLMFVNLLKLYRSLVPKKANYQIVAVRGSPKFGKVAELSYYEMLNKQTYEAIILLNTVCNNIDSYYLEIGLYSRSDIGRIFGESTNGKYSSYEVDFEKLLTCVRKILANELPVGYHKIDNFSL